MLTTGPESPLVIICRLYNLFNNYIIALLWHFSAIFKFYFHSVAYLYRGEEGLCRRKLRLAFAYICVLHKEIVSSRQI